MTDHSEDIGYLRSKAENAESQLGILFKKNDAQTALLTEVHTMMKTHIAQTTSQYGQLEKDVKDMSDQMKYCKDAADDHYAIKRFAKWGVIAISAAWAVVMKVIDKVL